MSSCQASTGAHNLMLAWNPDNPGQTIVRSVSVIANYSYVQFYVTKSDLHNYQAQVRCRANQHKFCWVLYGIWTGLPPSISFSQCQYDSTNAPYLHIKTTLIRSSGGTSLGTLKQIIVSSNTGKHWTENNFTCFLFIIFVQQMHNICSLMRAFVQDYGLIN
jgi:hypothetical protein